VTYVPQQKTNLILAAAAMPQRPTAPRWRRMRRRTLVLALVAAAVPVTVTATVIQLTGGPPPREAPLPTLGAGPNGRVVPRTALPALPRALGDAYAQLNRPATAADRDNAVVRQAELYARQFGLSADQARVLSTIDGKRVWMIPGNGYVCIGVQTVGDDLMDTGCETEATALKYGVSVSNTENIYGVLPDGIRQIDVTDDDGFHHVESVNDNVYVLPPVSATVRYRDAQGDVVAFRVVA
jgi:hypothetical protein